MEPSFSTTNPISHEKENNILTTSPNLQFSSSDDHHQITLINSCKDKPPPLITSTCVSEVSLKNMTGQHHKYFPEGESPANNLRKHWKEVSVGGRIVIPERWGQEALLKDWIDYSSFDALLDPKGVGIAREALVAEAQAKGRSKGMMQKIVA